MEYFFDLPVDNSGEELTLKVRLVTFGYIYKFYVILDGQEIIFQKDDEQHFRMFSSINTSTKEISNQLIKAIIQALEKLKAIDSQKFTGQRKGSVSL